MLLVGKIRLSWQKTNVVCRRKIHENSVVDDDAWEILISGLLDDTKWRCKAIFQLIFRHHLGHWVISMSRTEEFNQSSIRSQSGHQESRSPETPKPQRIFQAKLLSWIRMYVCNSSLASLFQAITRFDSQIPNGMVSSRIMFEIMNENMLFLYSSSHTYRSKIFFPVSTPKNNAAFAGKARTKVGAS